MSTPPVNLAAASLLMAIIRQESEVPVPPNEAPYSCRRKVWLFRRSRYYRCRWAFDGSVWLRGLRDW
uniref:Secreted protein n=1 Tax=Panagrellus redivivus TaxID=6233 RepID=A0A7E4VPB7_PANRE